jgi:alanine racemase
MLASQQSSLTSLRRDAWVEIDLAALELNFGVVRKWLQKQTQLMAVVKSDAYGHGAPSVAPVFAAAGASHFGVASVDEGCQLRTAGIKQPVLILGPCPFWAISNALEANLQLTITSKDQVSNIVKVTTQSQRPANVHVKIDTGMHRLGVAPQHVKELLNTISSEQSLKLVGIFSHLAMADDDKVTAQQNEIFTEVLNALDSQHKPKLVHLASGDAARRFPDTHYDMVRVGLYLYGLEPRAVSGVVSPALSVRARINHMQEIEEGQSVGYNLTWTATRRSRLASIPIGYADGVDRRLSNNMDGLLMGKLIKQVGLISMDQMLFDITDVPEAEEGDVITLIGKDSAQAGSESRQLFLAEWANKLDSITYEMACRLRVRLPRIYTRSRTTQAN